MERSPRFGEALVRLLQELGANVVSRTETLAAGLDHLKSVKPALFVLDLDAAPQDVAITDLVDAVSASSPNTRIVLLFAELDELQVRQARRTRVCSCLIKTEKASKFRRTFKRLLTTSLVRSARIHDRAVASRSTRKARNKRKNAMARLTKRESQVLPYIARGFSTVEISEILHVQPKTVDVHKTRIMAKLDIHDRVTLTRFAIRERLIPVWEDRRSDSDGDQEPSQPTT